LKSQINFLKGGMSESYAQVIEISDTKASLFKSTPKLFSN